MSLYRICGECGASLDPGERCDCRPAAALDLIQPEESPHPDGGGGVLACPNCGSGEYLHNPDEAENRFCGQCGQPVDWSERP